jgi:hypothetical protein
MVNRFAFDYSISGTNVSKGYHGTIHVFVRTDNGHSGVFMVSTR